MLILNTFDCNSDIVARKQTRFFLLFGSKLKSWSIDSFERRRRNLCVHQYHSAARRSWYKVKVKVLTHKLVSLKNFHLYTSQAQIENAGILNRIQFR